PPGRRRRARRRRRAGRAQRRRRPRVPRTPGRVRQGARRDRARQARDGQLRVQIRRHDAEDERLHAARLLEGREVPGAVPAPRHRRGRGRVATLRRPRPAPRQPDRRRQGEADDRRHAQRPGAAERPRRGRRLPRRPRVRQVRGRPAEGRDPVRREELLGKGRPRAPRAGRPVDGRRAVAELRARAPRHVRVGRRVLLGAQHEAARGTRAGPGGGEGQAQAPVPLLWQQGRADARQPDAPRVPEGERRPPHLARRRQRPRRGALEEHAVPLPSAGLPV
ncbi:MAG: Endo-1,4-beta-xylanase, partial [uncultured Phycisphaerae bacterium]